MDEPLVNLSQLSRMVGVPYYRIAYAHQTGALPPPGRLGHLRVYTPAMVATVTAYFHLRDKEATDAGTGSDQG